MDASSAITALQEARPPATDPFTYLTLIETHLSPEILPELDTILQDAELTQTIGWDLVDKLVKLPGCETCLETIARLGNPREVIIKVNEALSQLDLDEGYEADEEDQKLPATDDVSYTHKFIALLSMLAILHSRIKTKFPSRFLADTLTAVFNAYQNPDEEMTAAVVNLVHSLSGRRRPTLPSRKSSVNVANPDQYGDASKNAPDPEADRGGGVDPVEAGMQTRMLLSFVTCVLEVYTNYHDVAWSARLYEFYRPEKIVNGPGRVSTLASFREDPHLLAKDAFIGQLVALIADLGLVSCSRRFIKHLRDRPVCRNPFEVFEDASVPEDIPLSTGGCLVLVAYWVFSSTIFDANRPKPDMHIFPDLLMILDKFLGGNEPDEVVASLPGVIEALVALGLRLEDNKLISATTSSPEAKPVAPSDEIEEHSSDFMKFVHFSTLIGLYHPRKLTKNAAIALAGQVLRHNPVQDDRLRILYDILENCDFASVKAVALTWFRDELLAAAAAKGPAGNGNGDIFANTQAIDTVQYVVFPNLAELNDLGVDELLERIQEDMLFYMQAVNFGLFLWTNGERWAGVLPANLDATVRERWWEPLVGALERIEKGKEKEVEGEGEGEVMGELEILMDRLKLLGAAEGFRAIV